MNRPAHGEHKGDELSFRDWLIWQLKLSRWSKINSETPADLARRLGVQEDVLVQAIDERERGIKMHAKRHIVEQCKFTLWIPSEIRKDWDELCSGLQVKGGVVLRSIINHFLVTPTPPLRLKKTWHYRGKLHQLNIHNRWKLQTRISRGARQAIEQHARLLRVTSAVLVKGLVIDMLEGRTGRFKMVVLSDMWGDPRRYLHPELFQGEMTQ